MALGKKGCSAALNCPPEYYCRDAGTPCRHYIPLGKKGCSAAFNCPPGYYCKTAFSNCQKEQSPGKSCLAGQHGQCRGQSKCILTARGGKCSAGRDGRNPPGEKGNPRNQHYHALGESGCSVASKCPQGIGVKDLDNPVKKANQVLVDALHQPLIHSIGRFLLHTLF